MGQPVKNVIIYVFSGTGNTLTAADALAAHLQEYGIRTDIYRIRLSADSCRFENVPDPGNYDAVCFGYPIHAFNSPQFFLRFVKALPVLPPEKRGLPAYIFKTSGEPFRPNRSSSFSLCRILKKKGMKPVSDMHMLMPYNIMFRYPDAMAKQMYLHTTTVMAAKLADQIASGSFLPVRFNPLRVVFSYLLRLQWFGAWINGPLHHVDKSVCTGCGICKKGCPSANITMQAAGDANSGKCFPSFGMKCTMCMRCTMFCPQDAIKPGFLSPWKVYPAWDYQKLLSNSAVSDNWTDRKEAGYFKLFRGYYADNSD